VCAQPVPVDSRTLRVTGPRDVAATDRRGTSVVVIALQRIRTGRDCWLRLARLSCCRAIHIFPRPARREKPADTGIYLAEPPVLRPLSVRVEPTPPFPQARRHQVVAGPAAGNASHPKHFPPKGADRASRSIREGVVTSDIFPAVRLRQCDWLLRNSAPAPTRLPSGAQPGTPRPAHAVLNSCSGAAVEAGYARSGANPSARVVTEPHRPTSRIP